MLAINLYVAEKIFMTAKLILDKAYKENGNTTAHLESQVFGGGVIDLHDRVFQLFLQVITRLLQPLRFHA